MPDLIDPGAVLDAEEREALRKARMTPYEDGKGGWLFRAATLDELALAVARIVAEREARALREAADYLSDEDEAINTALRGVDHPIGVLRDRADRIEVLVKKDCAYGHMDLQEIRADDQIILIVCSHCGERYVRVTPEEKERTYTAAEVGDLQASEATLVATPLRNRIAQLEKRIAELVGGEQ